MINLFSKSKGYFTAGLSLCFLVAAGLLHDHKPWYTILAITLTGVYLSWLIASISAFMLHRRILNLFYAQLNPHVFITVYQPLLRKANIRKNILFTMKCYLSNAYAAEGQYQKALAVLDSVPVFTGKKRRQCEAILAGNRCELYCAQEMPGAAREEYLKLEELVSAGEVSQKPILDLLQAKIHLLEGKATKEDYEVVRGLLSPTATRYYQVTVKYLLGRFNEQLGEIAFARAYYSEVAKAAPQIAVAGNAAKRLEELPDTAE